MYAKYPSQRVKKFTSPLPPFPGTFDLDISHDFFAVPAEDKGIHDIISSATNLIIKFYNSNNYTVLGVHSSIRVLLGAACQCFCVYVGLFQNVKVHDIH